MKRKFRLLNVIGGVLGSTGILYASYYGKIGYLVSAIGFTMLTVSAVLNSKSAPTRS